jgi:hypothetical protein
MECASPLALSEGFGVIGTDKRPMLEVEATHEPRPYRSRSQRVEKNQAGLDEPRS